MAISNCMGDNNLEYFSIVTLVDITATGVTRNHLGNDHARNQQRNWETVLQAIGIRAQPTIVSKPTTDILPEDLIQRLFSDFYNGEQRVWTASFSIEHRDVYKSDDGNQLGFLLEDFNQVPVITGLDETAKFMLPIFYSHGAIKNFTVFPGLY